MPIQNQRKTISVSGREYSIFVTQNIESFEAYAVDNGQAVENPELLALLLSYSRALWFIESMMSPSQADLLANATNARITLQNIEIINTLEQAYGVVVAGASILSSLASVSVGATTPKSAASTLAKEFGSLSAEAAKDFFFGFVATSLIESLEPISLRAYSKYLDYRSPSVSSINADELSGVINDINVAISIGHQSALFNSSFDGFQESTWTEIFLDFVGSALGPLGDKLLIDRLATPETTAEFSRYYDQYKVWSEFNDLFDLYSILDFSKQPLELAADLERFLEVHRETFVGQEVGFFDASQIASDAGIFSQLHTEGDATQGLPFIENIESSTDENPESQPAPSPLLSVFAKELSIVKGSSVPLLALFPKENWADQDGIYDITRFSVKDRTLGGGYLTAGGVAVPELRVFESTIADLPNWRFVAANGAAIDEIGFNIIQADGDFSPRLEPGAIVTTVEVPRLRPSEPEPELSPEIARLDLDNDSTGDARLEGLAIRFDIERRDNLDGDIVVRWTVRGTGSNPAEPSDFVRTTDTVTLRDGDSEQGFAVGIVQDRIPEGDETFRIDLEVVSGFAEFSDDDETATILNDDAPLGIDPSVDDHGNSPSLASVIEEDLWARGFIETPSDEDWFRFDLRAGVGYEIIVIADNDLSLVGGDPDANFATLNDRRLRLYDEDLNLVTASFISSTTQRDYYRFEPTSDGSYYLSVEDDGANDIGQYFVQADVRTEADDYAGDPGTTGSLVLGRPAAGSHERDYDDDWFRVDLIAGRTYRFVAFEDDRLALRPDQVEGTDGRYFFGWDDPILSIHNPSGALLATRPDAWPDSTNLLEFTASYSGAHFLSVDGTGDQIRRYVALAQEVDGQPSDNKLILQPGPAGVDDVRFAIYSPATAGVDDAALLVNGGNSSAIRFDLDGLPSAADYAAVEVFLASSSSTSGPGDIVVDVPTGEWTESSPLFDVGGLEFLTAIPDPTVGEWVTIEITDLYNRWLSGDVANNGIVLSASEFGSSPVASFHSSDFADATLRPRLVISGQQAETRVSGDFRAAIAEDEIATGAIGITGPAILGATFANAAASGSYGEITVNAAGDTWTYRPGAQAQRLNEGDVVIERVVISSADGTGQTIEVELTGRDDPAIILGPSIATLAESATASGSVAIIDVDSADTPSLGGAGATGTWGDLSVNSDGSIWTYIPFSSTVSALNAGDVVTDVLELVGSDGTSRSYVFEILGEGGGTPPSAPALNFSTAGVSSFLPGDQDQGDFTISPDGLTLSQQSQSWEQVLGAFSIEADTWLQFDFSAAVEGEIHAIMFANGEALAPATTIQLAGTQTYGLQDFNDYVAGSGVRSYDIPIGELFTGDYDRMIFVTDDDANVGAEQDWANVTLTSAVAPPPPSAPALDFSTAGVSSFLPGDQDQGDFTISPDGLTLSQQSQSWEQVLGAFSIEADTWLQFDFSAAVEGEIHAIMFANGEALAPATTIQLAGTQTYGLQDFNDYVAGSGVRSYDIPIGELFTGDYDRMIFVTDDDANVGAEQDWANVILM